MSAWQGMRDAKRAAMTQPLDINKLAREIAHNTATRVFTEHGLEQSILAALTKLAAEKRTTAERCSERLSTENETLTADLTRHKAALKVAACALQRITEELKQCS